MLKTVKDMYKYASDNSSMLLSNYSSDWWKDYRDNYQLYDKIFLRFYRTWWYFQQENDQTISEITTDFTAEVYNHLMLNERKYAELYRIHVLPDEDYSLTNNYDMHEVMDKDTTSSGSDTFGQRSDSTSYGAQSNSDTIGAQSNTQTNTVAPYNTSTYQNDTQVEESLGARSDSHNLGAHTDGFTKGAQSDSHSGSGTEDYTLHRYGNIGVMTVTDMLKKHDDFWTVWEFYERIFRDIARELLMIGG
jgi:hypothetical protein